MRRFCWFGLAVVTLGLVGCRCRDEEPAARRPPRAKPTAEPRAEMAPAPLVDAEVHPALRGAHYRHDAVAPLAADCHSPVAVLDEASRSQAALPGAFGVARQVLGANPQFQVVDELRGQQGHLVLLRAARESTKNVVLLARCSDATTCNVLAAAYKSIVPTSQPQLFCGKPPDVGEMRPAAIFNLNKPSAVLPAAHDIAGQCARLAACQAARDGRLGGDPIANCQMSPKNYRLHCARQQSCAAVLACLDQ